MLETNEKSQLGQTKNPHIRHGACIRNFRLYSVWKTMRARCHNPKDAKYRIYGARGIAVCEEWRTDPNAFLDWAERSGYQPGLQIDRLDNNGGYSPKNCRWATRREQARNTRRNSLLTIGGATMPVVAWAELKDIPAKRIYNWVRRKGAAEAARRVAVGALQAKSADA